VSEDVSRFRPARLAEALSRRRTRWTKFAGQLRRPRPEGQKLPVFVGGCHRSGTSMLMDTIEVSPHTWVYHESSYNLAFRDYRLRPLSWIDRLVEWTRARWVVFKPVCDAHLMDHILERFPAARIIWPYRSYQDVANSAVRKWGAHHREIMGAIARQDRAWLGWRGERLDPVVVQCVANLYRDDMSLEAAASLQWYLRNHFFFELALDKDPRVLLLRYEDLVAAPKEHFRRIFSFVGNCPLDGLNLSAISTRSVARAPFPDIDPEIAALCDELTSRLDAQNAAQDN